MTRTIGFITQAAALAAQASIEARIKEFASAASYSVDAGGVLPKVLFNGVPATGAQKTTSFGAVSGSGSNWTIPHPEYHSLRRQQLVSLGKSYQSYVLQDLGALTLAGTVDTFDLANPTAAGWAKYSEQVLPGLGGGTFFDPWVVKDGSTYLMYVSWRDTGAVARCTSSDGYTWSAPVVVLPQSGSLGAASRASVVRMSATDWRMWYTRQLGNNMSIYYATSTDGVNWVTSDTPVLTPTQAWESQTNPVVQQPVVLWDAANFKFRMWYSGGASYEPVAIGYAESTDGTTWTKNAGNPIFSADTTHLWEQAFVGVGTVLQYGGYFYMFYISYRSADAATISVARSVDGQTAWERHTNNPLIRPSISIADQDYDACYRPGVIIDGSKWRCWYNGRNGSLAYPETIMLAEHAGADLLW